MPTVGASVLITGVNLGGFSLTSTVAAFLDQVRSSQCPYPLGMSAHLSLLCDEQAIPLIITSCTQSHIIISVPPGDGVNHSVVFIVEGQSSNTVLISYAPPTVTGVSPTFSTG